MDQGGGWGADGGERGVRDREREGGAGRKEDREGGRVGGGEETCLELETQPAHRNLPGRRCFE